MDFSKLFPNLKKTTEKDLKDKEKSLSVGDHVSVVKNIRCVQAGKSGVITKINPEDKYGWKSFVVKFDDSKYGSMAFQSGDLNKTVKTACDHGTKRNLNGLIKLAKLSDIDWYSLSAPLMLGGAGSIIGSIIDRKKRKRGALLGALIGGGAGLYSPIKKSIIGNVVKPTDAFITDYINTSANRLARNIGIVPNDKSIIPGVTIKHLGKKQEEWLRQAIMTKHRGKVPESGSFGGGRKGRKFDDYHDHVHPGFYYGQFPDPDANSEVKEESTWYKPSTWDIVNKARMALWRNTGVPNQIEYMLGDWSWNTDKNGNIIVNDTYDFNIGEGKKQKGRYGELRRWAGEHLSRSIDPDSQKIKFRINLGNPKDWGKYDKGKFMSFNEPYRERFPGMYYYN